MKRRNQISGQFRAHTIENDRKPGMPPWSWNNRPMSTPTMATLRWIKSKQIAYAKARSAA
jgi:hypothetical protein